VLPYEDSLKSFERLAPTLSIVSPAIYRLHIDNKTAQLEDWDPAVPFPRARLVAAGKSTVLPLVGCIGPCGAQLGAILDDPVARKKHVQELVRVVSKDRLSGLFIDYENVGASRTNVTRFVHELAMALHQRKKKLAIVVEEPCGTDPACHRDPYPFDLRSIARDVDWLAVMEYDFSVDASAPPAPREWVTRGLQKVGAEIGGPHALRKVLCGIPFYGRITPGLAADTAVLWTDIAPDVTKNPPKIAVDTPVFDADALAKVANARSGNASGRVYFEDHESLAERLALARRAGVAGIAIWRLGGEDSENEAPLRLYRRVGLPK
jgi:spore germination protein YaaH